MHKVSIIGMGMSPEDLTQRHLDVIGSSDILIGGERHLCYYDHLPMEKMVIKKNIKEIVRFVKEERREKRIVVLASGDPLFFGIGSLVVSALGRESVKIYPNITSVGAAFARLGKPWSNVRVVSMHGRDGKKELLKALYDGKGVAIYTDSKNTPWFIADFLLGKGFDSLKMDVLQRMGEEDESAFSLTLEEAAKRSFKEPNMVVLSGETGEDRPLLQLGTEDGLFHHRQGLITKSEVRAVTLSKLKLSTRSILWDLGAGSGSVSVEASLFIKKGSITAVEKNSQRVEDIRKNIKKFAARNVEVAQLNLPEGLDTLPGPDRVFIGGGGFALSDIIRNSSGRLAPGGVIVINTVVIESMQVALKTLKELNYKTDIVQIQVSRGSAMPGGERLSALNPVWIISGEKGV